MALLCFYMRVGCGTSPEMIKEDQFGQNKIKIRKLFGKDANCCVKSIYEVHI